jgi:hypothetical protein
MNRETGAPLCDALAGWIAGPLPAAPPDWDEATWDDFRTVAQVHGAAPLLWLRAREVPAWATSPLGIWLADQHLWNGRRIERLHGELGEILRLFWDEGVPLLPLKGAVLGPLYYEDAAARPMADLDVLLRDEHREAGAALLARLGYAKTFSGWKHARFARPGSEGIADPTREHPDNPRQLEVHPRCRERLRDEVIDLTDLMWDTARRGELLGAPAWLPAPEALWLHLLVHATHHILLNNFRLVQLADLARLAPAVADPAGVVGRVDARATYPALALLGRYGALTTQSASVPAAFAVWADGLDLYEVCHLNAVPWRA